MLDAMHYQQPYTVFVATASIVGLALLAAAVAVAAWWSLRRWGIAGALAVALLPAALLGGCAEEGDGAPLQTPTTF
ncbi:MAG: hypothetical protein IH802_02235, partial [Nitrospinae bacterium]|nr:hypothetical protein [Nitrospinota bacterium]